MIFFLKLEKFCYQSGGGEGEPVAAGKSSGCIQQRAAGKLNLKSYSLKALNTEYYLESFFYASSSALSN